MADKPKKKARHSKETQLLYNNKTFDGHKLTCKEAKFIDEYVATGNARQSVIAAGYSTKAPGQVANNLLKKVYINDEIQHRLDEIKSQKIADATEILEYLTSVMRGEEKDQFGLDAPLSERTKAAQELAKRKIDIPNKLAGKGDGNAEVKIVLDWKRD